MYLFTRLLTVFFLSLGPVAACASSLGIRLSFEPATLDWNLGDVPIHVINNVVEGLFAIDTAGRVAPVEAQGMPKKSGKAGVWRIRLRQNLRWSDGARLRAADYVASWQRLLDPRTGSSYAYLLFDLEGARERNAGKATAWNGARAISDHEIELQLSNVKAKAFPVAVFTHWATFPVRSDLLGADWGVRPEKMAFNGRYRIASYTPDVKLELTPNAHHRHPGKLPKIEALIVQDDATALRLYEAGRLHFIAELGTLDRKAVAARSDFRSVRSPVLVYLGFDATDSMFATSSSRRALSLAIDRTHLPDIAGGGIAPISELGLDRDVVWGLDRQSAQKAAPQLKNKQFSFGYFERGINRTVAEFLQNQWKTNLGALAELRASEVKSYWKKLAQKPYPVFLNTFGPPVWDRAYYFKLLASSNPMNMGRWSNTAYDRALEQGDFKTASRILKEELPVVPLYFRAYEYLMSPHLKGAVLNPMTSLYLGDASLNTTEMKTSAQ